MATNLVHLDRALAWEGFDVDVIRYGQSFTSADLADAQLVLALPVIDYPSGGDDSTQYDERWRPDEIDLLVRYVEQGGFLILTDSANHLFHRQVLDANEDWEDANALAAPFGIHFGGVPFRTIRAQVVGTHPITGDLFDLVMLADNGLRLTLQGGVVLAEAQGEAAIGLLDVGGAGGQAAIGAMASSRLTNEEIYLFQKLFRESIGTNRIDLDDPGKEAAEALAKTLGWPASTNSIQEIRKADCILVIGTDPAQTHPIIRNEIHLAIRRNRAQLIVLGNYDIDLTRATQISPLLPAGITLLDRPGMEAPLINAMLQALFQEGLEDKGFIEERTEGIKELRGKRMAALKPLSKEG